MRPGRKDELRLAETLAALSLVTDLARGHPPEEAMRATLIASLVGRELGIREPDAHDTYYATLLRYVGCTATSEAYTRSLGGDDVEARRLGDLMDPSVPREALGYLWTLSRRAGPARPLVLGQMLLHAREVGQAGAAADCEVGARLATRFGFSATLETALLNGFERWDGLGAPNHVRGDAIPLPSRLATLGFAVAMLDAIGGPQAATEVVGRWRGRILDPSLVDVFLRSSGDFLRAASPEDAWAAVVAIDPGPRRSVDEATLDAIASGFADIADLKSHYLLGHSAAVARLSEAAGRQMHLPDEQLAQLRWAALFHDVGRVGVATRVWDKPGRLSHAEWEEVRLHPYHTQRIMSRSPALAEIGTIAGRHHERLDGRGYPSGLPAGAIQPAARLLAAADVYQALREPRPHRPARSRSEAGSILRDLSAPGGGLDPDACGAVLAAAGERPPARRQYPAGLTEREMDVLQLLARGRTEREIAEALTIAPATAHTHVAHIYEKAAVSTRAALTLFALEHHLLRPVKDPLNSR